MTGDMATTAPAKKDHLDEKLKIQKDLSGILSKIQSKTPTKQACAHVNPKNIPTVFSHIFISSKNFVLSKD